MKIRALLMLILTMAIVTGCGYNMSDETRQRFENDAMAASMALYNNTYCDPDNLLSETELVAYTLEDEVKYELTFIFIQDDGQVLYFDTAASRANLKNDNEYREWTKAGYITDLLKRLEDNNARPGKFAGVLLKWNDYNIMGNIFQTPTLVDFDGNGTWDYITNSHVCYFSEVEANGYPRNEETNITLISLAELYSLEGIKGNEKLSFFESYLEQKRQ